jgi:hypothetical protein
MHPTDPQSFLWIELKSSIEQKYITIFTNLQVKIIISLNFKYR